MLKFEEKKSVAKRLMTSNLEFQNLKAIKMLQLSWWQLMARLFIISCFYKETISLNTIKVKICGLLDIFNAQWVLFAMWNVQLCWYSFTAYWNRQVLHGSRNYYKIFRAWRKWFWVLGFKLLAYATSYNIHTQVVGSGLTNFLRWQK